MDIGLDIFQFFIETLSFEALTGSLVRLGIPKGGANGEFAAELRHRTVRSSFWDTKANKAAGKSLEAQRINRMSSSSAHLQV